MLRLLICAAALCCFVTAQQTQDPLDVVGQFGTQIKLYCKLGNKNIMWRDYSTNITHGQYITKRTDGKVVVDLSQPSYEKLEAEANMLIFKNLSRENIGKYSCEDGTSVQKFIVTGLEPTKCTTSGSTTEGMNISLNCEVAYSGFKVPQIRYRINGEDVPGEEYEDDGDFFFFGRRYRASVKATPELNGQPITCELFYEPKPPDFTTSCIKFVDVQYTARDLEITPQPDTVYVGDEVNCTARGNPTPTIIWDPVPAKETEGQGWRSFKVTESMVSSEVTYSCMAYNEVKGKKTDLTKAFIFTAAVRPATTTTTMAPKPTKTMVATTTGASPGAAESTSGEGGSVGAVAGAIVAIVVIVIIVVVIVVLVQRRRQKRKEYIEEPSTLLWKTNMAHPGESVKIKVNETKNGSVPENDTKEDTVMYVDDDKKEDDTEKA